MLHGYASGAYINQECSLCRRPCCLGPNFEFGVRGHVSDKAPSAFFSHLPVTRFRVVSSLKARYGSGYTLRTQHGERITGTPTDDPEPWCVTSKVASRAKLQMFFARARTKPHRVFSHPPVTRFRVVSSLKALPCRPLSSPVVPACRPLCFCVVPCRPRIFKIKII